MSKLALIASLAAILATPAIAGWRDQRIDGTSAPAFERSVALLLKELPRRRRDDFEVALAVIWLRHTSNGGDLNHDGVADAGDAGLLKKAAADLWIEIERGDLVSAIEEREKQGSDYTAADYFKELDGLQVDGVLRLAGLHGSELAAFKRKIACSHPVMLFQIRECAGRPLFPGSVNTDWK